MRAAYLGSLFAEQRAYVTDTSKTVAGLCSRRAGKSWGNAARLKRASDRHPGEMSLYVALTKNNARMIVGKALAEMSRKYALGLVLKEVDQRLMCIAPNGHHMWLAGAKNRIDFEQFRGYKFGEVIIDEAQLYSAWLQEVVEEILEPCVGDLDGAIVLSGTPSPLPIGFFHSATTGLDQSADGTPIPQWSTHTWTVGENVFFRNGQGRAWRSEVQKRRGWTEDHPTLLREYFGRWVRDEGALVYPYDAAKNAWSGELPPGQWFYALGVDLGASGTTAFVVLACRQNHPELYILECETWSGLIPSRIAAYIEAYKQRYKFARIVVDEGGLGKGYADEFNQTYGIGCEPAEKTQKRGYIELARGDMMSGVVKINPFKARELVNEMQALQWNEERTDVDDRFPDHACDAFLYGSRALHPWYRPELVGPEPGTPAWLAAEMAKAKKERAKQIRERSQKGRSFLRR